MRREQKLKHYLNSLDQKSLIKMLIDLLLEKEVISDVLERLLED